MLVIFSISLFERSADSFQFVWCMSLCLFMTNSLSILWLINDKKSVFVCLGLVFGLWKGNSINWRCDISSVAKKKQQQRMSNYSITRSSFALVTKRKPKMLNIAYPAGIKDIKSLSSVHPFRINWIQIWLNTLQPERALAHTYTKSNIIRNDTWTNQVYSSITEWKKINIVHIEWANEHLSTSSFDFFLLLFVSWFSCFESNGRAVTDRYNMYQWYARSVGWLVIWHWHR